MLKLIRGGCVYTPRRLGRADVLLGGTQILKIAPDIMPPPGLETEIIDAANMYVIPGLIDAHVHIIGAGGGEGPASRTREVDVSTVAKAGITTLVGTLGIDTVSFGLGHLLTAARALDEQGISTLVYTGGYQLPAVTVTGSVTTDLALIDKAVGVKIALFDTLSSHPAMETLAQLASKTALGGRLGGKAGLLHAHIGDTDGDFPALAALLRSMGLPPSMLVTTHINRSAAVLERAIRGALAGLSPDITALYTPDNGLPESVSAGKALRALLEAGVAPEAVTLSSDGNASLPLRNEKGEVTGFLLTPVNMVALELKRAVQRDGWSLEDILPIATENPARRLRILDRKGTLAEGKDADVVLLDDSLEVRTVIARGRTLLLDGVPQVRGRFEEAYRETGRL